MARGQGVVTPDTLLSYQWKEEPTVPAVPTTMMETDVSKKKEPFRTAMPDGRLPDLVRQTGEGESIVVRPAGPPGPDEDAVKPDPLPKPTNTKPDPIYGERPTDKRIAESKRRQAKRYDQSAEGRRELREHRQTIQWLREQGYGRPSPAVIRSIEIAYREAVAGGYEESPQSRSVDPANPFGWTLTEATVVRMHVVEGLSFREIGRRRGTSHVAALTAYKNAKAKAVSTDTADSGQ